MNNKNLLMIGLVILALALLAFFMFSSKVENNNMPATGYNQPSDKSAVINQELDNFDVGDVNTDEIDADLNSL